MLYRPLFVVYIFCNQVISSYIYFIYVFIYVLYMHCVYMYMYLSVIIIHDKDFHILTYTYAIHLSAKNEHIVGMHVFRIFIQFCLVSVVGFVVFSLSVFKLVVEY